MADAKGIRAGRAAIELSMSGSKVVQAQLKKLQARAAAIGSTFRNIGSTMLAAGGAIGGAFILPIKAASDMNENLNKFSAVFGEESTAAGDFADELAKRIGRSSTEIRDSMASYQAMFTGLGFDPSEARKMSQQLSELALDFASFHNLTDEEASTRFLAALGGSSEVFDKFGINTKAAAINQKLLAMGIDKTTATASEMEKVMARVAIIQDSMGAQGATGDATTTAGSFGNQVKRLQAALKDTMATIGTAVLPTVTKFVQVINAGVGIVSNFIAQNANLIRGVALVGAGLVVAGSAFLATGLTISAFGVALGGIATVLGAILSPIGLVVAGLAGLTTWFATSTEAGRALVNNLSGWFANLAGTFRDTFGGIIKSLSAGDMQLAGQVAMAGLQLAWLQGVNSIQRKWREFKGYFVKATIGAVYDALGWWATFKAGLFKRWNELQTRSRQVGANIGHYLSRSSDPAVAADQDRAHKGALANIAREGAAKRSEIDGQRDEQLKSLQAEQDLAMAGAKMRDDAAEREAKTRLDAAREELKLALQRADVAAAEVASAKIAAVQAAGIGPQAVAIKQAIASHSPQGTFDTRLARQLFGGTSAEGQMVKHLANIDKNTKRRPGERAGIPVGA